MDFLKVSIRNVEPVRHVGAIRDIAADLTQANSYITQAMSGIIGNDFLSFKDIDDAIKRLLDAKDKAINWKTLYGVENKPVQEGETVQG